MKLLLTVSALLAATLLVGGAVDAVNSPDNAPRASDTASGLPSVPRSAPAFVDLRFRSLLGKSQTQLMTWLNHKHFTKDAAVFGCSASRTPQLGRNSVGFEICDGRVSWVWQSHAGIGLGPPTKSTIEFQPSQSAFASWVMP